MDKVKELLKDLSAEDRQELSRFLRKENDAKRESNRAAYEQLRHNFATEVKNKVLSVTATVTGFKTWLDGEADGFLSLMEEYGRLNRKGQRSYTVIDGDFKLEVKCNKVKGFDERADAAAERLMDYLKGYVAKSDKGTEDPMYQLAMTLLERNKAGELDYKSISKLYELEGKFPDAEYSEIMNLFRESNIVNRTATNYYFFKRDDKGVWHRIEPSFCRM